MARETGVEERHSCVGVFTEALGSINSVDEGRLIDELFTSLPPGCKS